MLKNHVVNALKELHTEDDVKVVLRAILQNSLICDELNHGGFNKILSILPRPIQVSAWNPATIALASQGIDIHLIQELKTKKVSDINPEIANVSIKTFEKFLIQKDFVPSLKNAINLAFFLNDQLKDAEKLENINKINFKDIYREKNKEFWGCILACLINFQNDPISLLEKFITELKNKDSIEIIASAILSNPLPSQELIELFVNVFTNQKLLNIICALNYISRCGWQTICKEISRQIIKNHPELSLPSDEIEKSMHPSGWGEILNLTSKIHQIALLRYYAGMDQDASELFDLTKKLLEKHNNTLEEITNEINKPSLPKKNINDLILSLNFINHDSQISINEIEKLITNDQIDEAVKQFNELQKTQKANPISYKTSAKINYLLGGYLRALDEIIIALSIDPNDRESKIIAGRIYRATNEYEKGFNLLYRDDQIFNNICRDDLYLFLELANRTKNYEAVVRICEEEIKDQENSRLFSFLAEAQIGLKQNQPALINLKKALELDRSNSFAWILLAKLEIISGEIEKAIEALLTGIKYCPKSQQLYIELSKNYIKQNSTSAIDKYLSAAMNLSPKSINDVVELVGLVCANKCEGDVISFVQTALIKWPLNYQLKILYAELLLERSMFMESKNLLKELTQTDEFDEKGLSNYFFSLIGSTKNKFPFTDKHKSSDISEIKHAVAILQDLTPESPWLSMFNAEVAYLEDDINESIKIYSDLLKKIESTPQDIRWRIQAGMARLQMIKGEYESAITLLCEAINCNNDLPDIYILLFDAYKKEGLVNNAYKTAIEIIERFPLSKKIMDWFKDELVRIGRIDVAINHIEKGNLSNDDKNFLRLYLSCQISNANTTRELIHKYLSENSLNSNQVIIIANLLGKIGDTDKAIEILLNAKEDCIEGNLINFLLACIYRKCDRLTEAMASLNNSSLRIVNTYRPFLCLEMAIFAHDEEKIGISVNEIEKKPMMLSHDFEEFLDSINLEKEFLPESWRDIITKPENSFISAAIEYYKSGNYQKSMEMIVKAKEINPENNKANWLFAEISRSLLINLDEVNSNFNFDKLEFDENEKEYLINLYCLKAENALSKREDILAASIVSKIFPGNEENLRIKSVQARLLFREGDLENAQRLLKEVANSIMKIEQEKKYGDEYFDNDSWLVATALDLGNWDLAKERISNAIEQKKMSAFITLMAIKFLCMIEINNDLCQKTHAINHLVDSDRLKKDIHSILDNQRSYLAYENPIFYEWISILRLLEYNSWDKLEINTNYDNAEIFAYASRKNDKNELLKSIINQYNDHPGVLLQACIKNYDNNLNESLTYIDQSILINPNNPISYALKALILEKHKKIVDALTAIENAIAYWPNEFEWHIRAAELNRQMGNINREISHLEFAYQLDPKNPDIRKKLMRSYLESGDLDNSVKLINKNENLSSYTFDELLILAEINLRKHLYKETYELAMEAVRKEPGGSQPQIILARMAIELKNYQKAQEYLEIVFASSRENKEAHLLMSKLIEEKKGIGEALNYLDLNFQETSDEDVIIKKGEYIKAISGPYESRKYLLQFDNLEIPSILTNLALTEIELGLFDEGDRHAQISLNKNSNQPILLSSLGALYLKQGNLDRSLHFYLDALNLEPNSIKHYLNLSEIYILRREQIYAIDILRKGIQIFPNEMKLYKEAGKVYWSIKDYRKAEEMFRHAIEINPDDDEVQRQLGAIMSINLIHQKQEVN